MDDDPWSDGDGDGDARRGIQGALDMEWRNRQRQFHTLGYRDGVTAGKESSAQNGFDAGFKDSVRAGFDWGVARGMISAFAALSSNHQELLVPDKDGRDDLKSFQGIVSGTSSKNALASYHGHHVLHDGSSPVADVLALSSEVKAAAQKASIAYDDALHNWKGHTATNIESGNFQDKS